MADSLRGGIVINEVLVDPNGPSNNFDTDGNGTAEATDEFVELVNTSDAPIDISGLQFWDAANDNWFTIPDGTELAPGARAVVVAGLQTGGTLPTGGPDDLAFDAGRGTAVLNNGGDNVVVYDPLADTYIQATYNGDALDTPENIYNGFSATANRIGAGEDFGSDTDGLSLQRFPDGGDTFVNDEAPTPAAQNLCFTPGTLIQTASGLRPVETLQQGDMVWTLDDVLQPLGWVGRSYLDPAALAANQRLTPIRVQAGALGPGRPARDMVLSPQHRVLVRGQIARRMFGEAEILVPVKDLTHCPGISPAKDLAEVAYLHLMFDRHQLVVADGAVAESLYAGAQALAAIDAPQRAELLSLFPELKFRSKISVPPPARPIIRGSKARGLARRHAKNRKPLFSEHVYG